MSFAYAREIRVFVFILALAMLLTFVDSSSLSFPLLLIALSYVYVISFEGLRFQNIGIAFERFILRASIIGVIIFFIFSQLGASWSYGKDTFSLLRLILICIAESLFWIGVVQRKLQETNFIFGLITTALLFSLSHINSWYFSSFQYNLLSAFALMLVFGYLYNITSRVYTGNLLPPTIARLVFSLLLFFLR